MLNRLVLVVGLAACGERTQLMIGVATDLRAPDVLDDAQLVISREGVPIHQVAWPISGSPSEPENLPGSYGIFSEGQEFLLDVNLTGFKNGEPIVTRRAVLSFIEGRTLFLRMTLVAGCVAKTDCASSESCVEGVCRDREIDSRTLPPFADNLVTELTCNSGTQYIFTDTNELMQPSADAASCPSNLCSEGVCHVDPDSTTPGVDAGQVIPVLPPHTYVLDRQTIPQNNNEARQLGLDLNGDATVDNQLGMIMSTFASFGIATQTLADVTVDKGQAITLINIGADSLASSDPATFQSFIGDNPLPAACLDAGDMTCRRHLAGTASFGISPSAPLTTPLLGKIAGGKMTAGPGEQSLLIALVSVVRLDLIGSRISVSSISENALTGIIAGGVTQDDMMTKVVPAWQSAFAAQMAADCPTSIPPSCGCANGSQGETIQSLFDTNTDCVITVSEVQDNSLIQSLMAPDVTIGGQPALSFGIGFTAVPGAFQLPF